MASAFSVKNRNPDVLECIANLSSDEVFTPPSLANQMLDSIAESWATDNDGADIWADNTVTFLDPCTKSGVFLREIAKRLIEGLETQIPDLQDRVNHILTKQVFGIGITTITSLLARRSLYCSKHANGEHSIVKSFDDDDGNIWFERIEHTWSNGRCTFCGVGERIFSRGADKESHAYKLIHTDNIKGLGPEVFGRQMQFDVVIGNPPYQMKGGAGGTSASSIYHLFVEQARSLEPKYMSMVIPSRWLAGGRGLDDFRKSMLNSNKLLRLVDYPVSREVFPSVEVKGGICFFLWSKSHNGDCDVTVIRGDEAHSSIRKLNEFDVFIRNPLSASILHKVIEEGVNPISNILTADTPFGIASNYVGDKARQRLGYISLYKRKGGKRAVGFVPRLSIKKNVDLIDKWKVLVPKAGSDGGKKIPDSVLGKPWICPPPSVATQTFLAFSVESEAEARSLESYYRTKFFRHLVSLRKLTQDALRPMYSWVPQQKWDRTWTDDQLYEKYKLTPEEQAFIESQIKPMIVESGVDE